MRSDSFLFRGGARVPETLLLIAAIITTAPLPFQAQARGSREAEFCTFYNDFRLAVAANDKNRITDLIAFPVRDWSVERKGNVENLRTDYGHNYE